MAIEITRNLARELVEQLRKGLGDGETAAVEPAEKVDFTQIEPVEESSVPYLVVGKAEAKPGNVATIKILGHTLRPVTGFGMGIGIHSDLELVGWRVPESLQSVVSETQPIVECAKYGEKAYNAGNYLQVFLGFFEPVLGADDVNHVVDELNRLDKELEEGKISEEEHTFKSSAIKADMRRRNVVEAVLPPMTELFELDLRVPPTAKSGTKYDLLNRHNWFGRPMKGGLIKRLYIANIFTTTREVASYGIKPNLVSGWIDVV